MAEPQDIDLETPRPRRWLRLSAWIAAGLLALMIAVLGFFATGPGRQTLAGLLNAALSNRQTGSAVHIGRINGSLYGHFTIDEIVLADRRGVWLTLKGIDADWSPSQLLLRRVRIAHLTVAQAALARLPQGGKTKTGWTNPIPSLPVDFRLDDGRIQILTVAGAPQSGRLSATLGLTRGQDVQTRIDLSAGAADRLYLALDYDRAANSLMANGSLNAPAGGLLARLASPARPLGIQGSLSGQGALQNWKGKLALRRDDGLSVSADLAAMGHMAVTWQALVSADFDAALPRQWAAAQAGRLTADLRLALKPGEPGQLFAMIDSRQFHVEAALLPGSDSASFKIASRDLTGLDAAIGGVTLASLTAEGSARDLSANPGVRLTFAADRLVTPALAMARFEGGADIATAGPNVAVTANGWMRDVGGGGDVGWTVKAGWNGERLRVEQLKLAGKPLTLTASGQMGGGALDAVFAAGLPDLRRIGPAGRFGGSLALEGRIKAGRGKPVDVAVKGQGRDVAIGVPALDGLLKGSLALDLAASRATGQGDIALRQASIKNEAMALAVTGRLNDQARSLGLDYRFDLRDGSRLPLADVKGAVTLAGAVGGSFDAPRVSGRLGLAQIQVEQVLLRQFAVSFDLADALRAPSGPVRLSAQAQSGPVTLAADMQGGAERKLNIPALSLKMPGGSVTGHLAKRDWDAPVEGHVAADFASLSLPALMAGFAADGAGKATLDFSDAGAAGQGVNFRLDARNLGQLSGGQLLAVKSLVAMGDMTIGAQPLWRALSLEAKNIRRGEMALDVATARLSADGAIAVHAQGRYQAPLRLDAAGILRRQGDVQTVRLASLTGEILKRQIRLTRPAEARLEPGRASLDSVALAVGDGAVEGDYRQDGDDINAGLRLKAFDLALASLAMPELAAEGRLTGQASLRRQNGRVAANWQAQIDGLRPQLTTRSREAALQVASSGRLTDAHFDSTARLTDGVSVLDINFGVPVRRRPGGWPVLAESGPFNLRLQGNADLGKLSKLLPYSEHRISGMASLALQGAGTLAEPGLTGGITWTNGRYEHGTTGFLADQAAAQIMLAGRTLEVQHLSATDGGDGRMSAHGRLALDSDLRLTGEIQADVQNARLVKRRDMTLWASGQVTYRRETDHALASGKLRIDRAEATLGDQTPPEIVELNVTDINGYTMRTPAERRAAAFPTRLDMALSAAGPVFVRGYGLDSVWLGDLRVTGTADRPVLVGVLTTERGTFEFVGKRFSIENGSLSFTGNVPIDPDLTVKAQYEGPDITAIVELSGPSSRPDIKLSSSPALPTDEILARALFGTTTDKLTPLEAVRLADALAGFGRKRGGLGGGVFSKARRGLGLDSFDIRSNGDNSPIFSGEKYIGKDLYLQVETGTEPGTSAATVAYAISRHLTLESTATSANKTSLRIRWKKDY